MTEGRRRILAVMGFGVGAALLVIFYVRISRDGNDPAAWAIMAGLALAGIVRMLVTDRKPDWREIGFAAAVFVLATVQAARFSNI